MSKAFSWRDAFPHRQRHALPYRFFAEMAFAVTGWAILVFLHCYQISRIPGLHYDEAWAFNFSWKIGPGFWPLTAMSPYTSPWAHYWASLWLHLLGPSVAVYRGSQMGLALSGLVLLSFALPRHIRGVFPWACLLVPGMILNQRFAIELTGLHVFCFGLLAWSLRRELWLLAVAAAFIGTTAHILFYAVAIALLGTACFESVPLPKRARIGAMVYFAAIGLFFLRVLLLIPEKGKAAALLASAIAALTLLAIHGEKWIGWKSGWWKGLLALPFVVFFFNCLFFAQGAWSASVLFGLNLWNVAPEVCVPGFLLLLVALAPGARLAPRTYRTFLLLLTTLAGVMMLKPAPRYYELPMLVLPCLVCWDFWRWLYDPEWKNMYTHRFRIARASFPMGANLTLVFCLFYVYSTQPSRYVEDIQLHTLFFRDSSRDFLDKQTLVRFLGGSGCHPGDIQTHDPRLREELDALSLGDWPVSAGNCPYALVARRTEDGARGEAFGEFLLQKR